MSFDRETAVGVVLEEYEAKLTTMSLPELESALMDAKRTLAQLEELDRLAMADFSRSYAPVALETWQSLRPDEETDALLIATRQVVLAEQHLRRFRARLAYGNARAKMQRPAPLRTTA